MHSIPLQQWLTLLRGVYRADWISGPQRLCRSQECLRQQLLKEDGLKAAPLEMGCLFMRRALSSPKLMVKLGACSAGKQFLLQMINSWVEIYATRASKPDTDEQSEKMVMQLSPLSPRTNADTCTHNPHARRQTHLHSHSHSRMCTQIHAHVTAWKHTYAPSSSIHTALVCTHTDMQACVHR